MLVHAALHAWYASSERVHDPIRHVYHGVRHSDNMMLLYTLEVVAYAQCLFHRL